MRLVGRGSGSGSTFPVAGSGPVLLRHGVAGDGPSEAIFCRRLAKGGSSGGGFRAAMAAEVDAALRQREELDRPLLTRRRDLEQLFGVSRARAATLMRLFGAELTGHALTRVSSCCGSCGRTGSGASSARRSSGAPVC